jgi:hypothetical protein
MGRLMGLTMMWLSGTHHVDQRIQPHTLLLLLLLMMLMLSSVLQLAARQCHPHPPLHASCPQHSLRLRPL